MAGAHTSTGPSLPVRRLRAALVAALAVSAVGGAAAAGGVGPFADGPVSAQPPSAPAEEDWEKGADPFPETSPPLTTSPSPTATPSRTPTPTRTPRPSATARTPSVKTPLSERLTVTRIGLPTALPYLQSGYNGLPEWARIDTAVAPDGTLRVAWPASGSIHVTPLTAALKRAGADTVVDDAQEVSGLVAHKGGFALFTRLPDSNKWNETAAHLVRYSDTGRLFDTALTGTATHDTARVLVGQLRWNGSKYGAYFVVHGAGGSTDGHFGDKLRYVSSQGKVLDGGWNWGCSHNQGTALLPSDSGPFPSLCGDDWRSGIFVSTGIGAPNEAPLISREECWAGYCGGTPGGFVRIGSRYAVAFTTRGTASQAPDGTGRGYKVTARTQTHQVALRFLSDPSTPSGSVKTLTSALSVDNVNVRLAPYGKDRMMISWESYADARCSQGTCTGRFTGTHLRLIDTAGKFLTGDLTVRARIAGDIASLPNGDLVWAFADEKPDRTGPLNGASPTTRTLSVTRLAYAP
jgi:hypothetical protein